MINLKTLIENRFTFLQVLIVIIILSLLYSGFIYLIAKTQARPKQTVILNYRPDEYSAFFLDELSIINSAFYYMGKRDKKLRKYAEAMTARLYEYFGSESGITDTTIWQDYDEVDEP